MATVEAEVAMAEAVVMEAVVAGNLAEAGLEAAVDGPAVVADGNPVEAAVDMEAVVVMEGAAAMEAAAKL